MRRKLIDLKQQRSTLLEGAEALLKEGKRRPHGEGLQHERGN